MNYIEVKFACKPVNGDIADVLSAVIADVGFESFVTTENGLTAYIQENLFDKEQLDLILGNFSNSGYFS